MTSPYFNMWKFFLSTAKGSKLNRKWKEWSGTITFFWCSRAESLKGWSSVARPGFKFGFCVISFVTLLINMCFWCNWLHLFCAFWEMAYCLCTFCNSQWTLLLLSVSLRIWITQTQLLGQRSKRQKPWSKGSSGPCLIK